MTNKIFIFILVWSLALAAWTGANPPAGTPGITSGAIVADDVGNIDIGNKASTANTTAKKTAFTLRGRDTVGTVKLTGRIAALPEDSNWINGALGFFTRGPNTAGSQTDPSEKMRITSTGYVGIGTTAPVSPLDIQTNGTAAGAVVIRNGFLNMNNNAIKNLLAPVNADEAVNKAYVDAQTGGSNAAKLWGEGRPGTTVINTAGECTVNSIKISRSARPVDWGASAAACPAGWWVCGASERGAGACGSGTRQAIGCDTRNVNESGVVIWNELFPQTNDWAWVSDVGSGVNTEYGRYITTGGAADNNEICSMRPVWCCSR